MARSTDRDDLARIDAALDVAAAALAPFPPGAVDARMKRGDDPLTEADMAVDAALATHLPRAGEGWLSEETADDLGRLEADRAWIVDPLDGTREFVAGIPEWCVSIGLVVGGRPVAGGVLNPARGMRIVGSVDEGVRSVRSMGSVAYKLALVSAGLADATWTLVPKNEWDVAAGAALVTAAGGEVFGLDFSEIRLNEPDTLIPGIVATAPGIAGAIRDLLSAQADGTLVSTG